MIRIIRTRYLGPTETKGSRIVATDLRTGKRIVVGYDHAAHDAHVVVADKLAASLKHDGAGKLGTEAIETVAIHWYGSVQDDSSHDRYHVYEY